MTTKEISERIKNVFKILRKPAMNLPTALIGLCGSSKPGLSTIVSMGNIAKTLSKHSIPTGVLEDGTENKEMVIATAIVDEIYRALREDANYQVSLNPGSVNVMTFGANSGGPVVSEGTNTNFVPGKVNPL